MWFVPNIFPINSAPLSVWKVLKSHKNTKPFPLLFKVYGKFHSNTAYESGKTTHKIKNKSPKIKLKHRVEILTSLYISIKISLNKYYSFSTFSSGLALFICFFLIPDTCEQKFEYCVILLRETSTTHNTRFKHK